MNRKAVARELMKVARDVVPRSRKALWEIDTYPDSKAFRARLVDVGRDAISNPRTQGSVRGVETSRSSVDFYMTDGWIVSIAWDAFDPATATNVRFVFFVDTPAGKRVVRGEAHEFDASKVAAPDVIDVAKRYYQTAQRKAGRGASLDVIAGEVARAAKLQIGAEPGETVTVELEDNPGNYWGNTGEAPVLVARWPSGWYDSEIFHESKGGRIVPNRFGKSVGMLPRTGNMGSRSIFFEYSPANARKVIQAIKKAGYGVTDKISADDRR